MPGRRVRRWNVRYGLAAVDGGYDSADMRRRFRDNPRRHLHEAEPAGHEEEAAGKEFQQFISIAAAG